MLAEESLPDSGAIDDPNQVMQSRYENIFQNQD
jgi:hypothetical protein